MTALRICLVGATHPCHNPRLLREADTLAEMGHEVRVVAPSYMPELVEKDRRLLARRPWRLQTADFSPDRRLRALLVRGRRRLAAELSRWLRMESLAVHGYQLAFAELRRLALRQPADWFIAHTQPVLPIAAEAAARWNARLGFDCEDLLAYARKEPHELVRNIERRFLPQCAYVSTASHAMAAQLAQDYGMPSPLVLYNVFPLRMAEGMRPPPERPPASQLRLHWFGQTIGPGRGLEDAVRALALLETGAELHIRGWFYAGYRARLEALARDAGVAERLRFLPPLDHDQLVQAMDQCDVGLALELLDDGNGSRTVSNKLFSYLLAGLAVAASDTPGQREVMQQIPAAGFLYPPGDWRALAETLRIWALHREPLRAAQQAAWDAARSRFCWDLEREAFLRIFQSPAARQPAVLGEAR